MTRDVSTAAWPLVLEMSNVLYIEKLEMDLGEKVTSGDKWLVTCQGLLIVGYDTTETSRILSPKRCNNYERPMFLG